MCESLPVVVVGAGPQGLAAAAHLLERGLEPLVLERGRGAGAAVSEWSHVRLFSEWPELIDGASRRLLERGGWSAPRGGYPTGGEWVADYLSPLGDALGERLKTSVTVTGIARVGRDKVIDAGRADQPFVVRAIGADGAELQFRARAVLDASGTWSNPGPAGASGLPALGESAAADLISYRIPASVSHLAAKHVVVIGSGHSAAHAVIRLASLVQRAGSTRVEWAIRRSAPAGLSSADDQLPARGALGGRAEEAVAGAHVTEVTGFRAAEFRRTGEQLSIISEDGQQIDRVDHVIVLTGFRPDLSIVREVRSATDPRLEAVSRLASEIDPNVHSCGTVRATGALELAQPEPGFYIVGAKSYGRAPTFLALTGYEQVRSVAAELAGDHESAARNELVLPDSGVCCGSGDLDSDVAACCATPKPQVAIGARPLLPLA